MASVSDIKAGVAAALEEKPLKPFPLGLSSGSEEYRKAKYAGMAETLEKLEITPQQFREIVNGDKRAIVVRDRRSGDAGKSARA